MLKEEGEAPARVMSGEFVAFPGAGSPSNAPDTKQQTFLGESERFYIAYSRALEALTFNSKPIINSLTITAQQNVTMASSVVRALEQKLITVFSRELEIISNVLIIS